MEEKKYPVIDEDNGITTAAESVAVAYEAERSFSYLDRQKVFDYPKDYDSGIGPYSMEELNNRINEVEMDKTNPNKWIRVDDFWTAMKQTHLWL